MGVTTVTWEKTSRTKETLDAYGFGARAGAMAGTQTAATRDAGANYYNPAALGLLTDIQADVGYQFALPYLSINGGDQNVDASRGFAAGLSVPGQIGGVKLTLGVSVFLPDERLTRTRTYAAQRTRWSLYDNRPQRLFFATNIASGRQCLAGRACRIFPRFARQRKGAG